MSKLKVVCITAGIALLLGIAGGIGIGWLLFHCEPGTVDAGDPGPLSPTDWKDNSTAAQYAGDKINISGAMRQGNFFVTAWDNVKSNSREFPMTARCPASYRPYSIMIQPFILAGYSKELARFNAIAGLEAAFLWNYRRGSLGFGVMYAQGLIYDEYYVGTSFVGKIDFGKLKTIGE